MAGAAVMKWPEPRWVPVRGRAADRRVSVSGARGFPPARSTLSPGVQCLFATPKRHGCTLVTSLVSGAVTMEHSPGVVLRPAIVADASAIIEIYNREVMQTTATFDLVPRTLEEQQQWITARSGAFAAIVAVDDTTRQVVGFASLSPYKERPAYRTTVEDSVYVHRDFGGRGIGSALLGRLIDIARESGFHSIIGRIEVGGDASRALHARCGFELVGIEREVGRKFNRWLSVAVMQKML